MKRYRAKLKHDSGKITIYTMARNLEQAIEQILKAELAPRRAILSIEEA